MSQKEVGGSLSGPCYFVGAVGDVPVNSVVFGGIVPLVVVVVVEELK